MLRTASVLSFLVLALPASAGTTWIVDDDGPADFADLPQAVAGVAPGDTLIVLAGTYSNFELSKPLSILGLPGAQVGGGKVLDLAPGVVVTLSGLSFATNGLLRVENCAGTVVLDGLSLPKASATFLGSMDVRLRGCSLERGLFLDDSRAEVVSSEIEGRVGIFLGCPGDNGLTGLQLQNGSRAHVYRSEVRGGDGASANDVFNCLGGDGGTGIHVISGDLLLAGDPVHQVLGGWPGDGLGGAGSGVALVMKPGTHARVSGVTVWGSIGTAGQLETPQPRDASLFIIDQVGASENLTFRVQTEPGVSVELLLGRKATLGPQVGSDEVLLVEPLRVFNLGLAPANGVAGLNFVVPANLPDGFTFFAQGRVTFPGGETRYTNSVPVVVR